MELVLTERILLTPVQIPCKESWTTMQWTKMNQSGTPWTKEDQEGPRWSNVQRRLIVRSVHSVQSSARPPPKKLPCSRWSALKTILVIVIVVFSFINDKLIRYDLETFEHLRSSLGLPCNVPSAGSRFASCLYVHT